MSVQKIIIVGDKNVDKDSFKDKLMNLQRDSNVSTSNRFLSWTINQQQLKVEFKIVEPDELSAVRDSFYRSANGFICVFNVNDNQSLATVEKMRERILAVRSQTRIILVGIKSNDNESKKLRKVTKKDAKRTAKSWKAEYFETNVDGNQNIENCLNVLMKAIIENKHTRLVSGRTSLKNTLDRFKYYNCFN
ncbi:RAS-like protein [Euroglyphus maynei]|uniref:RAS-like protein n=1 Tax=Euroglyphus maynei TaxID=6958 RepID=A0A1Y3BQX4_EURMA|nr:RAS-like protein [Euroglyphus maynei]